MKKTAVLLFAIMLFFGCEKADAANERLKQPFETEAKVVWLGNEYSCHIVRDDTASLSITLSGSRLLEPVTFSVMQGGYTMRQGELEFSMPYDMAPAGSVAVMMQQGLVSLYDKPIEKENGEIIFRSPAATLRCNENDGSFISLSLQSGDMVFSDFIFK